MKWVCVCVCVCVCVLQIWWSSAELDPQAACYHQQVLPANWDDLTWLLPALETAQPVSVCVCVVCVLSMYLVSLAKLRSPVWTLRRPQQEAQKIFKANHSMDTEVIKAKVRLHLAACRVEQLFLFYIIQSWSLEITDRWPNRQRGWAELRHSTHIHTVNRQHGRQQPWLSAKEKRQISYLGILWALPRRQSWA